MLVSHASVLNQIKYDGKINSHCTDETIKSMVSKGTIVQVKGTRRVVHHRTTADYIITPYGSAALEVHDAQQKYESALIAATGFKVGDLVVYADQMTTPNAAVWTIEIIGVYDGSVEVTAKCNTRRGGCVLGERASAFVHAPVAPAVTENVAYPFIL